MSAAQNVSPSTQQPVLLGKKTAAGSAQIDFVLPAGFRRFDVDFDGVRSSVDVTPFYLRVSEDGGATFKSGAGDYAYGVVKVDIGVAAAGEGAAGAQIHLIGATGIDATAATSSIDGLISVRNPSGTLRSKKFFIETALEESDGSRCGYVGHGFYFGTANAINALRFFFAGANIATGDFYLLGYR